MKKTLILILTLFTVYVNSQTPTYIPFPSNYGSWVYRYYSDTGASTNIFAQYTLNGDTIIASNNYKKVFESTYYLGAIRENGKVIYFVPDTSANEYMLYDFNLGLGDTIIHPFGGAVCSNDTVTIYQVDSVLASDGYHRQLWLSSFAIWIEGIGSINYLLKPAENYCLSGDYKIECMENDASFLYTSPFSPFSSCDVGLSKIHRFNPDILILPNPSTGTFTIDLSKLNAKEILISDILGSLVVRQLTGNQDKIKFNNLNAGTYFLTVIDFDNQTYKTKIISTP
ncbi:MAG TPA: T9SS type A sorting domain-containing protein [Bacteroidia bacterium]